MHTKSSQMFVPLLVASHCAVTSEGNAFFISPLPLFGHSFVDTTATAKSNIDTQSISEVNEKAIGSQQKWRIVLMHVVFKREDL